MKESSESSLLEDPSLDATEACPVCVRPIPSDAPVGLCPNCLFGCAGATLTQSLPAALPTVPGYEILDFLGRGGMGVVYKARQLTPNRLVALKMIVSGEFAGKAELARFRSEMDILGQLHHPNIVTIYDGQGEQDGHPFFTMQLLENGTLADLIDEAQPRGAKQMARMILTIARAVQHGHELPRPILHLDLKPMNILLGHDGTPYVADFGLARLSGESSGFTTSMHQAGSPEYMAPERIQRATSGPSESWDVWSLGIMLYEVLTGQPPFESDGNIARLLLRIVHDDIPMPHKRRRGLPRDLELVCMTALEKDPAIRYPTVRAFADDLERAIHGYPTVAQERSVWARLWRWSRRHPLVALGASAVTALMLVVTVTALSLAKDLELELRKSVQEANAFAATMFSGSVLLQLRSFADHIEAAARDPAVRQVLERGEVNRSPQFLLPYMRKEFFSIVVVDLEGKPRMRAPDASNTPYFDDGKRYMHRDYFRGALRPSAHAYVAKAFTSNADEHFRIALSTLVRDASGRPLGVVSGSIVEDTTLGKHPIQDVESSDRVAALLAQHEPAPGHEQDPPDGLRVLVHRGIRDQRSEYKFRSDVMKRIMQLLVPSEDTEQFSDNRMKPVIIDDYEDPVPGYEGRWLAAITPVGNTGLFAVVQVRAEDAERPSVKLFRELSLRAGLPLAAVLLLLSAVAIWATQRRRP